MNSQPITRRTALGSLAAPLLSRGAGQKPNFLFILADDHAGYVWGADGNRTARTPALDDLAREGVRFARHYCNSPVCTPSRQSLFTGQMPHMAGVTRLMTPLADGKPTLARQFQKAGYTTAVFGKMHFQRPGLPGLHGFDIVHTEDLLTREWQAQVQPRPLPQATPVQPPWKPFKDPARIWLNAGKLPFGRLDEDMRACFQVRSVERFLDDHADRPFALWVSFLEPHSPFHFPYEYRQKYAARQFHPPSAGPQDRWQIPLVFRDLSEADKRGIMSAYYTSVEFLDRNIGRVLRKLRHLGLADDTLVVYTADHGYSLGQHGRFEKHCGYDPALCVPLVIRHPHKISPRVVKDLTEHIDVPATITDVLGLESLPVQHGRSLRPYLEGTPGHGRDHIFSEYLENEEAYIRTDRWKLVYCSGKRARKDGYVTDNPTPGRYTILYDLRADPDEFHNVAAGHSGVSAELKRLMLLRFHQTHPEAQYEAGQSVEDKLDFYLRPRDSQL